MIGALVLRPEPGAAATAGRLQALGVDVLRQPLFAVATVAWQAPDPDRFDALLLTSANAVRHAGDSLRRLARLPVVAVGEATAAAAQAAGLAVRLTGSRDVAAAVADARTQGLRGLLHLAGRDRVGSPGVEAITVYRSDQLPLPHGVARGWRDRVALVHSARAARRFAALVDHDGGERARIAVAALSPAVLEAVGPGWARREIAKRPTDAALVACAVALIDPLGRGVDKQRR